jgi:hypothetical protein
VLAAVVVVALQLATDHTLVQETVLLVMRVAFPKAAVAVAVAVLVVREALQQQFKMEEMAALVLLLLFLVLLSSMVVVAVAVVLVQQDILVLVNMVVEMGAKLLVAV